MITSNSDSSDTDWIGAPPWLKSQQKTQTAPNTSSNNENSATSFQIKLILHIMHYMLQYMTKRLLYLNKNIKSCESTITERQKILQHHDLSNDSFLFK